MPTLINGKEQRPNFDPHKNWTSERKFIIKPGASHMQIEAGVLKVFVELEAEMKKFVLPKCWKYVRYFRVDPKSPKQGVLGWRYVAR